MRTPRLLSQQDPRWSHVKLGSSPYTVGQVGCTITAVAMFSSKNPDWMARNLEFVNGANLVWKSVNKTGDLEFVWRQWSNPKPRVLEGLEKGEAIIVEVPAKNQYGGKHWVAVKSGGDTGLTVIDPDMGVKGVERYQSWEMLISSAHFSVKNSNIMSPQGLLNTLRKEKVDLTNIRNGQDWSGRLQGLINAGKTGSFYSELFDILRWSQNKVEYIDDPRLKEKIEELEAQLAEAPEAAVVEQLQAKDEEIGQLKTALHDQGVHYDRMKARVTEVEENRKQLKERIKELEGQIQEAKQAVVGAITAQSAPAQPEKWDWNKFIVGLSKDQTFQRGFRHTITFAIGVLASQFPEYAPYILGLAGVWGLGTEVQAFQVNQKQIVKEKK